MAESDSHPSSEFEGERITAYLGRAAQGDQDAQEQFCRLVYDQLRDAAKMLLWNGQRASYQPSALVNELFVRIFDRDLLRAAENRRYFFTAAVDQMRKILIDHHRKKKALKAGGDKQRVPIDGVLDQVLVNLQDKTKCELEDLEEALEKLAERSPRQAEIVRLRGTGGGLTRTLVGYEARVSTSWIYFC